MGNVNKTDKLDARGLATLLRNGTLPTVWIAPSEVRDERELPRTRMALCKIRVALKNRIHAMLAKYNLSLPTESDIFAPKWSGQLNQGIEQLPPETQKCLKQELELLDRVQGQIGVMEERMKVCIALTPDMQLLKTIPGVGSTTDYDRHPQASRAARENILNMSNVFQRMRASAVNSFWRGRMVRVYLTSVVWNLQQRRLFTATSRILFSIASILVAGSRMLSKDFWQAVAKPYSSGTFDAGIREAKQAA
jgi:hypothetical protein